MARRLPAALCCFSCCLGLAAAPVPAASPAPAATSPLEDGGQKLVNNDIQGAIRSLQGVVLTQPGSTDALHLLTIAYLHAGRNLQAASAAKDILRQPSLGREDRALNALLLGQARYGAFLEGAKQCQAQADALPNMNQLLNQMATHTFQTGSEDARGKYVVVMNGDVNAVDDLRSAQISLHDQIGKLINTLEEARDAFRLALETDPGLPWGHDGLGLVEIAQGYPGTARSEFLKELSLHGANGVTYAHLGELDASEGHDEDAIENLRRAISLTPQLQAPYEDLIPLYERKHDAERVQWVKGMTALLRGDQHAAESALSQPVPRTAELLCGQAQLALAQKHWDDARRLLTKARDREPQDPRIVSALGDVEEVNGRHSDAIRFYKQALALDPSCDAAWYGIGLAYDGQNDHESALADYKEAVQNNPNNPLAELNEAADEADLGQLGQAALSLHDYLRRFPTAGNTYAVESMLARLETK